MFGGFHSHDLFTYHYMVVLSLQKGHVETQTSPK